MLDFFSELIHNSERHIPAVTREVLYSFFESYSKINQIDIVKILKGHWIRIIMNRVKIPYLIKKAAQDIKSIPHEVELLISIQEAIEHNNTNFLSVAEIRSILQNYNENYDLIEENGFLEKGYFTPLFNERDKVSLAPKALYYIFLKRNINSLEFIHQFVVKYLSEDSYYLKISVTKFDEIFKKFETFYGENFPIGKENIIKESILDDKGDRFYLFNFLNADYSEYWRTLNDQIVGNVWNKMCANDFYDNDCIDIWLDKVTIHGEISAECFHFLDNSLKEDFLKIIEYRIINEEDILNCEEEINKVWISSGSMHNYALLYIIKDKLTTIMPPYERLILIQDINRQLESIFDHQTIRYRLNFLLRILIGIDQSRENSQFAFPIIRKLLRSSSDRPYLLKYISTLVQYSRPEIAPYLFIEPGFENIGALVIRKFNIDENALPYVDRDTFSLHREKLQTTINSEALEVLLSIIYKKEDKTEIASILVRVLLIMAQNIFTKPNLYRIKEDQIRIMLDEYDKAWKTIFHFRIPIKWINSYGSEQPLFILEILEQFFETIIAFKADINFNEFYKPELWRFDALIRLLKMVNDNVLIPKNNLKKEYDNVIQKLQSDIIGDLFVRYGTIFKTEFIPIRRTVLNDIEEQKIQFQSNVFGLDLIDWSSFLQLLKEEQQEKFYQLANL